MDSLLVTVLCFAFLSGFNAYPSGNYNFVCRDGEEYDMCRSPCEPTCDSIRRIGDSIRRIGPRNCSRPCVAGCFCREGYVRGRDNTCIPPEECSRAACPENQEYQQCGSACELNCTNLHDGIFCTKPCRKGCFCKPDYVRNAEGKCVDPRTCGVVGNHRCPANEVYVNCVNRCNTCWEDPYCRTTSCSFGCDCIPGYLRNSHGKCVTEEQCSYDVQQQPQQCGVNEVYVNCVNPCNYCSSERCDYDLYCRPGCDCEEGFFRNDRGVCVHEQECFAPACPENEIYLQCGPSCRSTCGNYRSLLNHPCKQECVPGCFCRGNYVIGPTGKCIKLQDCSVATHSCPKGETFYQCLPTCRKTCRSLSSLNEVCSMECKPGCFCQPGKVRNDDGKCVLPSQCPVQSYPPCKPGEAYYNCMPCQNTCDNPNVMCTQDCRPGCACEKGKILRRDGNCVEPSACRIVCGPNEEFLSCGSTCPLTCESLENPRRNCSSRCVRGCFCKAGFVLGPNNRCIPRENCTIGAGSGVEGRRGGPTESNITTSTSVSPTTPTPEVTTEPSVSNSTDRTTTTLSVTTAPAVSDPPTTSVAENATTITTAPAVENATTVTTTPTVENATLVTTTPAVENATNENTAPSVTNSTTTSEPTITTTTPTATNATEAQIATLETTAPTNSETTSLPSTENATPVVTTQTSEVSSAVSIETTEMVTSVTSVNTTSVN